MTCKLVKLVGLIGMNTLWFLARFLLLFVVVNQVWYNFIISFVHPLKNSISINLSTGLNVTTMTHVAFQSSPSGRYIFWRVNIIKGSSSEFNNVIKTRCQFGLMKIKLNICFHICWVYISMTNFHQSRMKIKDGMQIYRSLEYNLSASLIFQL